MSFYSIRQDSSRKALGLINPVKRALHNCHVWDEPKFIAHQEFRTIDFKPITSDIEIKEKAKWSDLFYLSEMGFTRKLLISSKFKALIERHKTSNLKFYKSTVFKASEDRTYWIPYLSEHMNEFIDFNKSSVVTREKANDQYVLSYHTINSQFEFEKLKLSNRKALIKNVFIKENMELDFFALMHVEGGIQYMVSEELKNEILTNQLTGILFQPEGTNYSEWLQSP